MWLSYARFGAESLRIYIEYSEPGCLEKIFKVLTDNHLRIRQYNPGSYPYPVIHANSCTIMVNGTADSCRKAIAMLQKMDGIEKALYT